EKDAFRPEDLDFALTLAGQAALAIEKAKAFEAERRLAEERKTLIELGQEITRQLEVSKVLDLVLERAIEITHSHSGVLVLRRGRQLQVAAEKGNPDPAGKIGRMLSLDEGVLGLVAREGNPQNVPDVDLPEWRDIFNPVIPGSRSALAMPLRLAGAEPAIRGVLNVESPETGHYRDGDLRLLSDLSDVALVALQNAERYEKAEKRRDRLKALHQVGHEVIRSPEDPNRVLQAMLEQALRLAQTAMAADLDLYDEGRLATHYLARWDEATGKVRQDRRDLPLDEAPPARGIMAWVAETRRPYRTGNTAGDPYFVQGRDTGSAAVQSELAVPLKRETPAGGELIGVLNVESALSDAFDDDDQDVLELVAAQAVVALANARNFQRAERRQGRFAALTRGVRELGQINDESQLDDAYRIVVEIGREYFKSQVVVRRLEDGILVLKRAAMAGGRPPFPGIPVGRGINGQAAHDRRTIVVPDADAPPPGTWAIQRADPSDLSFAVTPIQIGATGPYYGNLALSHKARNFFRHPDRQLLEGLAGELAVTLQRVDEVKAHKEAERRAVEAEAVSWIAEHAFSVAHELGNDIGLVPRRLRKISRAVSQGGPIEPVVETELEKIRAGVNQALQRSKRLRDELSETGRPQAAVIPARVILDDVCAEFKPRENVTVERLGPEELGEVRVVHGEIVRALLNFLMNAQEAMPRGGAITVFGEADESEVRLSVRDTGHGIPRENLQKIFRPLYSTKGSSGFGLFSARMNVLRNGGTIAVDSEVGKGSQFTIHLPRADTGGRSEVVPSRMSASTGAAAGGP
ncbi:MAG TPA: GAF domain-containing protein, partial [Thermoanaerobaculia bacterium]